MTTIKKFKEFFKQMYVYHTPVNSRIIYTMTNNYSFALMQKLFSVIMLFLIVENTEAQRKYDSNFPNTENPVSEGGNWINGGTIGLDWGNVLTTPGKVFGDQTPGSPPYKDPTAILTGRWDADQIAEGTVYSINPNASYYQEVEIRLRTSISAHSITGYEIFSRCLKTEAAYISIVRWNGPLGDFTELIHLDGLQYGVETRDILKATIFGNVITGYINNVQVVQVTDDTYTTGNPGIGFNYGVGNTNPDFGFTGFSASSAPSTGEATNTARGTTTSCNRRNVLLTAAVGLNLPMEERKQLYWSISSKLCHFENCRF